MNLIMPSSSNEDQYLAKQIINKLIEADQPHLKTLEIARVNFSELSINQNIWEILFNTGIKVTLINCKFSESEIVIIKSKATHICNQEYPQDEYLRNKTIIKLQNY